MHYIVTVQHHWSMLLQMVYMSLIYIMIHKFLNESKKTAFYLISQCVWTDFLF